MKSTVANFTRYMAIHVCISGKKIETWGCIWRTRLYCCYIFFNVQCTPTLQPLTCAKDQNFARAHLRSGGTNRKSPGKLQVSCGSHWNWKVCSSGKFSFLQKLTPPRPPTTMVKCIRKSWLDKLWRAPEGSRTKVARSEARERGSWGAAGEVLRGKLGWGAGRARVSAPPLFTCQTAEKTLALSDYQSLVKWRRKEPHWVSSADDKQ